MFSIFTKLWLALVIAIPILSSCISTQQTTLRDTTSSCEIDDEFVKKHLKMLKNPRILIAEDIMDEDERKEFAELGYSFVVRGDLNKDGYIDYAVVGKYDTSINSPLFVAIVSLKDNAITTEFLHKIPHDRAFLRVEPGSRLRCANTDEMFDVVFVAMRLWTEDAWGIAWDGKKYFKTNDCARVDSGSINYQRELEDRRWKLKLE
jgi:hypothetical protein